MARNDDLLKGMALGLGAAILAPVVIAALMPVIRPMARSALKAGIWAYEKGRETFEEFGETVDDLVAEVEGELLEAREAEEPGDELEERTVGAADT
jgi:hypothetical protein